MSFRPLLYLFFVLLFCFSGNLAAATLRGTVADAELKNNIPGATVKLSGNDTAFFTAADNNGAFRFTNITPGRYRLLVHALGYKDAVIDNIVVTSGKETVLAVLLHPAVYETGEVVISGKRNNQANNELTTVSVQTINPEEVNRFAGSRQDPSRMASGYAGVVSGGNTRNDIIVRGNSPAGLLWRLDGVDIPNPNHFSVTGSTGGAFAMLNNNLLLGADFITGAFPAEYGNRTAAVFDLQLRNGNNEKYEHTFQLGLNGLEFGTEGPVGKKGASYLVNGRALNFSLINKTGIDLGFEAVPHYEDATFRINIPTAKRGTFTFWGIAGNSGVDVSGGDEDTATWPEAFKDADFFNSHMYTVTGSNFAQYSDKTSGKIIVSYSAVVGDNQSERMFKNGTRVKTDHLRSNERMLQGSFQLTHRFTGKHLLKSGVTFKKQSTGFDIARYDEYSNTSFSVIADTANTALIQGYTHWQWKLNEALTMNTGLFAQYFEFTGKTVYEPRWALQWNKNRHQVTLGYGLHSQTADLLYALWRQPDTSGTGFTTPNRNIGFLRSHHLVLGYATRMIKNWVVKTEVYYQYLFDIPVSHAAGSTYFSLINSGADYAFDIGDSLVNDGIAYNYGAEFTLNRLFSKGWYMLATLSLFDSRYRDGAGVWRNTAFNAKYVGNLLGGKEWKLDAEGKRTLSADMRVNYAGGRRYIRQVLLNGQRHYETEAAYEHKWADYFRTDVKVAVNLNRKKSNHQLFAAVDNVTNYRNVFFMEWSDTQQQEVPVYQIGLFPYLGYRVLF